YGASVCLQRAAGDQRAHEVAPLGEDVDEAVAGPDLLVAVLAPERVGDVEPPADLLNVERRVVVRKVRVDEPALERHRLEVLTEDVDVAGCEVGGVQQAAVLAGGDRQAGVARAGGG